MTQKLINLSASPWLADWFKMGSDDLNAFLKANDLDGVEWLVYDGHKPLNHKGTKGWHLRYWPYWLDLWYGRQDGLLQNGFTSDVCQRVYGGQTKEALINWYRKEQKSAEAFGASYMVLHVCHVDLFEVFTGAYYYSDSQVIEATIELVNEAFNSHSPVTLLFENLWWPGMRFDHYDIVDQLMQGVHYRNKGLLMDLSHLAIGNGKIYSDKDLMQLIDATLLNLREYKNAIRGFHCSSPFVGDIFVRKQSKDHPHGVPGLDFTVDEQFERVLKFIMEMDTHKPIGQDVIEEIIKRYSPEWLIHELLPTSLEELWTWLA